MNATLLASAHKLSDEAARPSTPRGQPAWDPQGPAAADELVMTEEDSIGRMLNHWPKSR